MPRLTNVVIVDADDRGREILGYGFAGDGVEVSVAQDPADLDALTTQPDAAVVACRNPETQAVLTHLAKAPRWQNLPVLTLVAEADDAVAPTGLPNLMALPAFVRDIITAAKLLAAGAIQVADPDTVKEVNGSLSDFGLVFIVRTMVGLGWSGIVTVERADRRGEIRIDQGDVVSATVSSLQGPAALHQLLLWEEAALSLKLRKVAQLGHSFPRGKDLLEENERFLRDFSHATKNLGQTHSLFVQDLEKTAELGGNIPAEIVPVLKLFDGHRTLGDALEDSPFRVFDTLRTMTRLLELGALRRKAIERPTGGLKGQLRRPQVEEWVNRKGEAPTVSSRSGSPAVSAQALEPRSPPHNRRRRRRRTGEVPLSEGAARRESGGPGRRKSGNHNVVRSQAPEGSEAAAVAGTVSTERSGAQHARGELEVRAEEAAPVARASEGPSVVVALELEGAGEADVAGAGASTSEAEPPAQKTNGLSHPPAETSQEAGSVRAEGAEASVLPAGADTEAVPVPVDDAGPSARAAGTAPPAADQNRAPAETKDDGPRGEPAAEAAPMPDMAEPSAAEAAAPAEEAVPVATGNAGMRSAEIVTPEGEGPPTEELAAPAVGPSILLDPRLVEEMDAFEMANSPPTPPPVVVATAEPHPLPAQAPADPFARAAAASVASAAGAGKVAEPAPPRQSEPTAAPVVSFVRNEGSGAHANNPALNNAPTVPLSAVQAQRPGEKPSASPPRAVTPARLGPESPTPDQFDELESDFFARESELYETEATDNFEDLDGGRRRR